MRPKPVGSNGGPFKKPSPPAEALEAKLQQERSNLERAMFGGPTPTKYPVALDPHETLPKEEVSKEVTALAEVLGKVMSAQQTIAQTGFEKLTQAPQTRESTPRDSGQLNGRP